MICMSVSKTLRYQLERTILQRRYLLTIGSYAVGEGGGVKFYFITFLSDLPFTDNS
jgi:hypothetical protein